MGPGEAHLETFPDAPLGGAHLLTVRRCAPPGAVVPSRLPTSGPPWQYGLAPEVLGGQALPPTVGARLPTLPRVMGPRQFWQSGPRSPARSPVRSVGTTPEVPASPGPLAGHPCRAKGPLAYPLGKRVERRGNGSPDPAANRCVSGGRRRRGETRGNRW